MDFVISAGKTIIPKMISKQEAGCQDGYPDSFFQYLQFNRILCGVFTASSVQARELVRLNDLGLVDHPSNDGDSFRVKTAVGPLTLRLYFADCPETGAGSKVDAQRVPGPTISEMQLAINEPKPEPFASSRYLYS